VLGRLRLRRSSHAREEVVVYFTRLGEVPVHILVRELDQAGLRLGAELIAELMQEVFKGEILRDLGALVFFDASADRRALMEKARMWLPEEARRALREALRSMSPWCWGYGQYGEDRVAVVAAHPHVLFNAWLETSAHELIHHALRHPSPAENLRLLAEALIEARPSLRAHLGSPEELAQLNWEAARFLNEYAAEYIAHNYFTLARREPKPIWDIAHRLERALPFRPPEAYSAVRELLERREDEPLRRAAHELFLQWIQRFPADVYAMKLERLAEEAASRLRRLAEEPKPDALFEWARRLKPSFFGW
jgi:hypothetical protein